MPIPQDAPALRRSLLRDDVFTRLRDAIVDGTLAPGEQLRDLELAAWLGVSRTPVREALLRLGEAGLVVARPGRSTVVTPLDLRRRPGRPRRRGRDARGRRARAAVEPAHRGRPGRHARGQRPLPRRPAAAVTSTPRSRADDELHGVPVAAWPRTAADRWPCSTSSRPSCGAPSGCASRRSPAGTRWPGTTQLIRLCEAGDAPGAAARRLRHLALAGDRRPPPAPTDPRDGHGHLRLPPLPADLRAQPGAPPRPAHRPPRRRRRSGPSARTATRAWRTAATRPASSSTSSPTPSPRAPTRWSASAATSPTTPARSPRSRPSSGSRPCWCRRTGSTGPTASTTGSATSC